VIFAFVGFGELGSTLASGIAARGSNEIRVFTRRRGDAVALHERVVAARAVATPSLREAVSGADVVVAAVPASEARGVATAAKRDLAKDALYVDPAPLEPREKESIAALIADAGAVYADVAVVGTTAMDGPSVPCLACGSGADRWAAIAKRAGLNVRAIDGPPGRASLVKLLRSVYLKGRDALILEMIVAARQYGLEAEVVASVDGSGERVPFPALAERVLTALAIHSERRSAELAAAARVLEDVNVDPIVTRGASDRLGRFAQEGLRERFGGNRPRSLTEVLAAIDEMESGGVRA
jgi:3-hydroxyisobutyrate dehydrogenase-like beta-hydroxyacid dehydrogenase